MKILVTGAAGFVGRNLCASLNEIKLGHDKRADHMFTDTLSDIIVYQYD